MVVWEEGPRGSIVLFPNLKSDVSDVARMLLSVSQRASVALERSGVHLRAPLHQGITGMQTNGSGGQRHFRLIEYLSGAYYAIAVTAACLGLVIWSLHQESRISQLENDTRHYVTQMTDIDKNGTRFTHDEIAVVRNRIDNTERHLTDLDHQMSDRVNTVVSTFSVRIQEMSGRLNETEKRSSDVAGLVSLLKERQDTQAKQLDSLEKIREVISALLGAADIIKLKIERIEEQQSRVIQALDNTYNTLQEAIRGQNIHRQPTPYGGPTGQGSSRP